ncbi:hypothetical protein CCYA_CCYA11G3118 [Cyanidiococcus yangmingshanensis]|uniref:RING-type domain-containing protein n=1 Tax=Cyanidiococcus yangmingshanensis TaxID=2690220 RepID=A0A7J7IHH4_9RHOD|nr:hypothetical protein F1559_002170 [Cyanidiococcus yangmingshanensis]KAK4532261.1 hypothetical protein CCYA_CCYA11G3118 [Cyanidiococcus yangmingshanensis]
MAILVFGIVAAVCVCLLLAAWLYACVRERRALRRAVNRESAANRANGDAGDSSTAGNQRAIFVDGVYLYSIPGNPSVEQRPQPGGMTGPGFWGPTRIPASLVLTRLDKTSPPAPLTCCPSCGAANPAAAAALATVPNESQLEGKSSCGTDGVYCQCCSICLDPLMKGDMSRKLPCGHLFHSHCISKWVQRANRCPLCQHEIVPFEEVAQELRQTQGNRNAGLGPGAAAPTEVDLQGRSASDHSESEGNQRRENEPLPRTRSTQPYPFFGSLGPGLFFA